MSHSMATSAALISLQPQNHIISFLATSPSSTLTHLQWNHCAQRSHCTIGQAASWSTQAQRATDIMPHFSCHNFKGPATLHMVGTMWDITVTRPPGLVGTHTIFKGAILSGVKRCGYTIVLYVSYWREVMRQCCRMGRSNTNAAIWMWNKPKQTCGNAKHTFSNKILVLHDLYTSIFTVHN